MKAFDPIAAGFRWDESHQQFTVGEYPVVNTVLPSWDMTDTEAWFFVIGTVPLYIPASFDHDTVVALLRANGAMIEEVGDEQRK